MMLWDIATNNGSALNRYYQTSMVPPEDWNTFGTSIVTYKRPAWQYSTDFFQNCSGTWCSTQSGKKLAFLNPGNSFRWIETTP